jgi:chemotaxis protein MotB
VGYGEFQPVANATAEGRARNRRVVLVVSQSGCAPQPDGTGTAHAQPDAALKRAGTQTAPHRSERRDASAVNSPNPRINTLTMPVQHHGREERTE